MSSLKFQLFELPGIRLLYQNRYCSHGEYDSMGKQYSIKRCADKCKSDWNQFLVSTECDSDGECKCYCYLKKSNNVDQCTKWEEEEPWTQYAFTEPGMYMYPQFFIFHCHFDLFTF